MRSRSSKFETRSNGVGSIVGNFKAHRAVVVASRLEKLVEARHGALAALIDHQVAGDGEEPGFKPRLPVELRATHQHPHPDLLKKVFGLFAVRGEIKQITHQTVLIADNQLIQQPGFLPFEAFGDGEVFLPNLFVGDRDGARGEQRTNCRGGTHRIN